MNFYRRKQLIKRALVLTAILLAVLSQRYTATLVEHLKQEERHYVELWARATERLITATGQEDGEYEIIAMVLERNQTIPLLLTDGDSNILSSLNFPPGKEADSLFLYTELEKIRERRDPIEIDLGDGQYNYIYYKESIILRRIRYFPLVQIAVAILFAGVAYMAFSTSKRAEENRLWAGISKETAHQLGTPVSSLAAWTGLIGERYGDKRVTAEMEKDIARLTKITERFSQIGSRPDLAPADIAGLIESTVSYLRARVSSRVEITVSDLREKISPAMVNSELMEWVTENLIKNSIDAMGGEGTISITIKSVARGVTIDFCDTGKGIAKRDFKAVFKPGYTTRQRGWGLGLTLAKRIVEEYHNGKIFVKSSEPGRGCCMRVILNNRARRGPLININRVF